VRFKASRCRTEHDDIEQYTVSAVKQHNLSMPCVDLGCQRRDYTPGHWHSMPQQEWIACTEPRCAGQLLLPPLNDKIKIRPQGMGMSCHIWRGFQSEMREVDDLNVSCIPV
jgi:hypothetical protein